MSKSKTWLLVKDFFCPSPAPQKKAPAKDLIVSLQHAIYPRNLVARRCVHAAKHKGLKQDPNSIWSDITKHDSLFEPAEVFVTNPDSDGYGFRGKMGYLPPDKRYVTLEEFEEYCGVDHSKIQWREPFNYE